MMLIKSHIQHKFGIVLILQITNTAGCIISKQAELNGE